MGCGVWENFRLFYDRFREPESLTVTEISGSHRDDPRLSSKRRNCP
ncbi:MAG: hypothetical protein F6J93_18535 [Oscillatoria sp. SIO1A7]|nr:hypothetical protein [Oscillatoria sp. SIO1A7]